MSDASEPTTIGVSVGVDPLIAAAPAEDGLGTAFEIDGDHVVERFEILSEATQALQAAAFDTAAGEIQVFAALWHQLLPQVYDAAAQTVQYAERVGAPRLVLAAESVSTPSLWERRTSGGLAAWLCSALRHAVAAKARAAGVPVARGDPLGAGRVCHRCGRDARVRDGALVCEASGCLVGRVGRARSAAVRLARRAHR